MVFKLPMGVTLTWRDDPGDRDNRSYSVVVEFGGLADRITGYMVNSDRVGPGVVLVPDANGPVEWLHDLAVAIHREGFTVLVPNLYEGAEPSPEPGPGEEATIGRDKLVRRLQAAVAHLADNWHPRVGIVGFSDGAGLAAEVARGRPVDAAVLYCGLDGVDGIPAAVPILGHYGALDDADLLADATRFFERRRAAGAVVEMHVYDTAGPCFADPSGGRYDEPSALEAFATTVEFLQYHLS